MADNTIKIRWKREQHSNSSFIAAPTPTRYPPTTTQSTRAHHISCNLPHTDYLMRILTGIASWSKLAEVQNTDHSNTIDLS
ncbi:hypothetical protein ACH3XW_22515 [Acanthocheilonema viteae]